MTADREAAGFLKEPRVEFDRHEGQVVSAYIALRDGVKAVKSVQPNPDVLVFFYVAADGLPIGLRFHEPVSGIAVCELVYTLVDGQDGPEGVHQSARHHFFTNEQLAQIALAMKRTLENLEPHQAGAGL